MNMIDAIKSGRRFRRKGQDCWWDFRDMDLGTKPAIHISLEELLANDWEIEEPKVEITWTKFWEAAGKAFRFKAKDIGVDVWEFSGTPPPFERLAKFAQELGLEPK